VVKQSKNPTGPGIAHRSGTPGTLNTYPGLLGCAFGMNAFTQTCKRSVAAALCRGIVRHVIAAMTAVIVRDRTSFGHKPVFRNLINLKNGVAKPYVQP
jgi:hypothetical protein